MTLPAPDPMQEDFVDAKDDLLVQLVDETQPMDDGTFTFPTLLLLLSLVLLRSHATFETRSPFAQSCL